MRRTIFLGILVYLLLLTGLVLVRSPFIALALPLAVYLFLGLAFHPPEVKLEITRTLSQERVAPERPVTVTITVRNLGGALEHAFLEDQLSPALTVHDGKPRRLVTLPQGGSLTWEYTVSGPRGYHTFRGVNVTISEHLGLSQRVEHIPVTGQLFILPPVVRLRRVYIRPRQTLVYSGTIPARRGGPGVEFFGVRAYHPGDSRHRINWHASARHMDELYSNEFEQERVADVGVILDARIRTNFYKNRSIFEHSVMASAALMDAFLNEGNRVGLLLYGQYLQWTIPGYGKMQRERLLQTLARATTGDSLVFSDLAYIPTQLFPTNSQLVLVSPLHPDDMDILVRLRLREYHVMVISPDPISFEMQALPDDPALDMARRVLQMERDLLLTQVQRAGIQVVNWDVTRPIDQVLYAALGRPPVSLRFIPRRQM